MEIHEALHRYLATVPALSAIGDRIYEGAADPQAQKPYIEFGYSIGTRDQTHDGPIPIVTARFGLHVWDRTYRGARNNGMALVKALLAFRGLGDVDVANTTVSGPDDNPESGPNSLYDDFGVDLMAEIIYRER